MKTRLVLSMTFLSLTMAFAPTEASASGSICRQLESRLETVGAVSRPAADARLARAVRMARADGCGAGGYAVGRGGHCRAHANRIRRLQDMAASSVPAYDQRAMRSRIRAALRANACHDPRRRFGPAGEMIVRVDPLANALRDEAGDIPVPSPRPHSPAEIYHAQYVNYGRSLADAVALRTYARLVRSRPLPVGRRDIRVVGGKFLPEPNEEMEFRRIAMGRSDPANDLLTSVLGWVEGGLVSSAVAEETGVEEAR